VALTSGLSGSPLPLRPDFHQSTEKRCLFSDLDRRNLAARFLNRTPLRSPCSSRPSASRISSYGASVLSHRCHGLRCDQNGPRTGRAFPQGSHSVLIFQDGDRKMWPLADPLLSIPEASGSARMHGVKLQRRPVELPRLLAKRLDREWPYCLARDHVCW
jgi:hypothetical protein